MRPLSNSLLLCVLSALGEGIFENSLQYKQPKQFTECGTVPTHFPGACSFLFLLFFVVSVFFLSYKKRLIFTVFARGSLYLKLARWTIDRDSSSFWLSRS